MKLMTDYVFELESNGKYCFTLMDAVRDSGSVAGCDSLRLRKIQ